MSAFLPFALPFFLASVDFRFGHGENLRAQLLKPLAPVATIAFGRFWDQFFFCHGVNAAQTVQHGSGRPLPVSVLKVKRLPNTALAVRANRALSVILRVLKR